MIKTVYVNLKNMANFEARFTKSFHQAKPFFVTEVCLLSIM